MTRILNVEPKGYSAAARSILAEAGEVVDGELTRTELLENLDGFDVLVVRLGHTVDREVIDAAPRLRAVVTATTGLDHVDVSYAEARGVAVLSLAGETEFLRGITATAEHTWALLLALVRRIPAAVQSVAAGRWDRDAFRGRQLSGKGLGVVGLGRVGRQVAGYGVVFGMSVVAFDPAADDIPESVLRADTLPYLLGGADVLTLHVPLRADTAGMIGDSELALLPDGALLVNTSRGEVVDQDALLRALRGGRLAGAALDVVEGERDEASRASSPLLAYAREYVNLIVTPHLGGATVESMEATEVFMARKLVAFLGSARGPAGEPVRQGGT
ncbi:MAG: hydroxyacid dehydrogenase [Actinomycetota bacterium]|nr:hydroxyacid dehydrogenase [Actinomycetota bacterium]